MKEASLAETLLQQMKPDSGQLILSEKGPVLDILPPFLLKEIPAGDFRETNFHFEEFRSPAELTKKYPEAVLRKGHPFEIFRFLSGSSPVFLDFEGLGCVLLSSEPTGTEVKNTRMGLWLNYALSPELWGTEGKWTRFHEELHKVFEDKKLLDGHAVPGYYPLKSDARPWERYSLIGDKSESSFTIVLPWKFSLSDLRSLKAFINEEK